MFKSYYEHEKVTKNIYDGVREYCITEQVNEEYFRSSIGKDGLRDKPIKKNIQLKTVLGCFAQR